MMPEMSKSQAEKTYDSLVKALDEHQHLIVSIKPKFAAAEAKKGSTAEQLIRDCLKGLEQI